MIFGGFHPAQIVQLSKRETPISFFSKIAIAEKKQTSKQKHDRKRVKQKEDSTTPGRKQKNESREQKEA